MNRIEFIRAGLLLPLAPLLLREASASAAAVTAAQFVERAGVAGSFEIESSEIAQASAKRADVKSFAAQMIKDHKAAAEELKTTAGGKYALQARLDEKHRKMVDELKAASGDVDGPYIEMQLAAHKEAVELFQTFGKQGDDAALRAFAIKTLPTLQMHYDMIQKISTTQG